MLQGMTTLWLTSRCQVLQSVSSPAPPSLPALLVTIMANSRLQQGSPQRIGRCHSRFKLGFHFQIYNRKSVSRTQDVRGSNDRCYHVASWKLWDPVFLQLESGYLCIGCIDLFFFYFSFPIP